MALLDRADLLAALARLGELALVDGTTVELIVAGGGVMVLEYGTRPSTRDLDVVIGAGTDPQTMRRYAAVVASERGWPPDWLNDAVKGFLTGPITPTLMVELPGIRVFRPAVERC